MNILFLIIAFSASVIGSIVGAGGGVIIKPVMDALGFLPVSTISFLSGCTVLAMSISSLIRTRNSNVELCISTTVPLGIGAATGGIVGKYLFEVVRTSFGSEQALGAIQAGCLTIFTAIVLVYILTKNKIATLHVKNQFVALIIGLCLGVISSFLGIGGGTSNVAVLLLFFSMDTKTAAKNSIFIIMLSQIANILVSIVGKTVPAFSWITLVLMMAGGIGGAIVGAKISDKLQVAKVEKLLILLLLCIVMINLANLLKFLH